MTKEERTDLQADIADKIIDILHDEDVLTIAEHIGIIESVKAALILTTLGENS